MEWLVQGLNAEWIETVARWIKDNQLWLELGIAFVGAGAFCVGICKHVHKKWHRRLDEQRKINAMFALSGDRSNLNLKAPSRFLREEFQIVGFRGREEEIKELKNWACSTVPPGKSNVSIALVTGGPGRGKSRLARHLCERTKKWNSGIWIAGFLKEDAKHDDFPLLMRQRRSVLLVIDSAERRVDQVKELVSIALASGRGDYPVRVLLIARSKGKNEGWWSNLDRAFDDTTKYSVNPFEGVDPMELPSIENDPTIEGRRQEFSHALKAFREAFREVLRKEGEIEPKVRKDDIPNDLLRAQKVEALDIHLAALLTAYNVTVDPGNGQVKIEETLLKNLVKLEQEAWNKAIDEDLRGQGLKGKPIQRAISWLATTDGPKHSFQNDTDAITRLRLLPDFCEAAPALLQGVVKIVATLYPSDGEAWWGGVAPDRLTTWLTRELDEIIAGDMAKEQPKTLAHLPNDALADLLRHLTWRSQRYGDKREQNEHNQALVNAIRSGGGQGIVAAAEVGMETGTQIGDIAAKVLRDTKDVEVARKIDERIGTATVSLRKLAFAAVKILYSNATSGGERAKHAINLSIHLSGLGRREEALDVIEEAVAIHRELAETQSDMFHPGLIGSLNNLSVLLSDLGRHEEGLEAIKEAVAINRELAEARPGAFRPHLAGSLNNLSARLSRLGRREEALMAIEEAVAIHRELARPRPDAFRPDLALSLNNLSNGLSDLGRREEALDAIREAVAIRRELAEDQPDAFRPDLAESLNNLSARLFKLGRREEALAAIEEAVAIHRELAGARPDTFRPNLALSLNNLSNGLSGLGRHEEALDTIGEATAIRRKLAEARPDAFRPDLAQSLHNLAGRLFEFRRREEGLDAIEEAVTLHRELVEARPDAFLPYLALSLNSLSNGLSDLGRHEEGLDAIREAVAVHRELAEARPHAFLPDLAGSLNSLSVSLFRLRRSEEGIEVVKEAVTLYRKLAKAQPDAFRPDLAGSLNNLGNGLSGLGRHEEGLDAIKEAVAICRELAEARPGAFRPDLAGSLNNLGVLLSALGLGEKGLDAIQEAVAIRRELAEDQPDAFCSYLVWNLNVLGIFLFNLERREEALEVIEEAVAILRKLAENRPGEFRPHLAQNLNGLSTCLSALGRGEEGLDAIQEAVAIRRELAENQPGTFRPYLAESLHNLSLRLSDLGRNEEAFEASEEARRFGLGTDKQRK